MTTTPIPQRAWVGYVLVVLALLVLFLGMTGCVREEPSAGERKERLASALYGDNPIENGRITYELYCASCHGPEALGNGPVAEALTTAPSNLTTLAATNNGVYPAEAVYEFIDGQAEVAAHGTRMMPVWGNVWGERNGHVVPPEEVERRINEVVEYLRTLQTEADSSSG